MAFSECNAKMHQQKVVWIAEGLTVMKKRLAGRRFARFLLVRDNFYSNPDAVREIAQSMTYREHPDITGYMTDEVYQPAGIVAASLEPEDVIAVFERYDRPSFRAGIDRFVAQVTGAADARRTEIALAALDRLVGRQVA